MHAPDEGPGGGQSRVIKERCRGRVQHGGKAHCPSVDAASASESEQPVPVYAAVIQFFRSARNWPVPQTSRKASKERGQGVRGCDWRALVCSLTGRTFMFLCLKRNARVEGHRRAWCSRGKQYTHTSKNAYNPAVPATFHTRRAIQLL